MDFTPATSRPSRRLRRRLAVASAALLLASAPAFVAASSAGAANTAAESLDDHDDDKTTPGVRLISGSNRYATAIAAANAYVDNVSATGFVDTAIVVSGESIVDALAVAGLSAAKTAPILLTQSNRLPSAVASFLDDQFIAEVLVVGGTDAVSERVFEALEDVPSVDTVTRISGEDRYATAAAVADEIGADSEYCDTGQVGAVLVNGNSFVDAVSVAPLAYALQIPVLLTQAGELSSDAAGFLVDEEIEHVAIIGGTAAISEAVEEEVKSIVVGTTRIAGANRFATAVAVLKAIDDCDAGDVELDTGTVALTGTLSPSDGFTAAPALGEGLGTGGVTPVLLVTGNQLAPEVAAYLAGTPVKVSGGSLTHLGIVAIGGTGSVSAAAVDAAVAAATTSDPITAAISADIGTSEIKVKFSTAVDKAAAEKTANYNVFGGTLYGSDAVAYDEGTRTATITLQNDKVAAGTTVTLLGGKVTGVGTDLRKVATTDYEVPPAVIDRQRPRLSVIAPEGGHEFAVRITEANPADGEVVVPVEITLRGEKLAADTATLPYDGDAAKGVIVCLFGLVETDATDCEDDRETDDLAPLAAGDRIIVAAGAVKDESGNETRTTSAAVGPNSKTVRLQVATVTAPAARNLAGPDEPARPSVATWTSVGRVDREAQSHVAIAAKPDGAYPGAVGNGWWIQWNDLGAAADADDTADVSVLVIKPRRTIVVSFDDAATPSDAVDALNDDDVFSADFTASFVNREVDGTVDDISDSKTVLPALGLAGAREKLGDGESQVVLTLRYGSILDNFDHDAFRTHGSNENQTEGGWSTAAFTTSTDAPRWVASPSSEEKVLLTNEIKITLNGRNITEFPTPGDSVFLPDGVATDYAGTDSDAEVNPPRRLRPA